MGDWISVEDDLPNFEGKYHIKIEGEVEEEQPTDYYSPDIGFMWDWYAIPQFRVSHWKPIKNKGNIINSLDSETDKMKSELTRGIIQ